jgi:hypothetical protein
MINLIEIIKTECLPRRNCMLSVFESGGESGFLYFKDSQLIEVNSGKLWAKEALQTLFRWNLQSYTLGDLPRGIKRTIWEPLDKVIEDLAGAEAAHAIKVAAADDFSPGTRPSSAVSPMLPLAMQDPFLWFVDRLHTLPGFLAAMKDDGDSIHPLVGIAPAHVLSSEWFRQFSDKVGGMGDALGAGVLLEWYLETDVCRVWRFHIHERHIIIFSNVEVLPDEFEEAFHTLVGTEDA